MYLLRLRWVVLAIVIQICCVSFSHAGLILHINDATIGPGSSGFVDVFIKSDGLDMLSDFGFDFRIESQNGVVRQLRFAATQTDQQLGLANYVFASGSLKRDGESSFSIPPDAVGSVSTSPTGYLNDRYIGSDSVAPFTVTTGVPITNTEKLLVRLEFVSAPGLLAPVEGDEFRVSLASSPSTQFLDPNIAAINYSSNVGIIRVTAVPEPSSASLLLLFAAVFVAHRRKQCAASLRRRDVLNPIINL